MSIVDAMIGSAAFLRSESWKFASVHALRIVQNIVLYESGNQWVATGQYALANLGGREGGRTKWAGGLVG